MEWNWKRKPVGYIVFPVALLSAFANAVWIVCAIRAGVHKATFDPHLPWFPEPYETTAKWIFNSLLWSFLAGLCGLFFDKRKALSGWGVALSFTSILVIALLTGD
jgi:hypothetical protein